MGGEKLKGRMRNIAKGGGWFPAANGKKGGTNRMLSYRENPKCVSGGETVGGTPKTVEDRAHRREYLVFQPSWVNSCQINRRGG